MDNELSHDERMMMSKREAAGLTSDQSPPTTFSKPAKPAGFSAARPQDSSGKAGVQPAPVEPPVLVAEPVDVPAHLELAAQVAAAQVRQTIDGGAESSSLLTAAPADPQDAAIKALEGRVADLEKRLVDALDGAGAIRTPAAIADATKYLKRVSAFLDSLLGEAEIHFHNQL